MGSAVIGPEAYPSELRELPTPPEQLWMRGVWPSTETRRLAVVGSRALSPYGKEACEKLIAGLSGYPVSIVSGLAFGADACAHKAALAAGLHTIAIPGGGLGEHTIAPRAHRGLAEDILKAGGLLLSEHPDTYQAHPYDFPSRNRIMVGLSHAVLVIEAGAKSGTLITARLAGEYNRELLCVPHRIGDAHGVAATTFLRLGATLVTEAAHILEALRIEPLEKKVRISPVLEGNERLLFDLLEEPLSRDALIRASKLPAAEAGSALVTLELKGIIEETFGAWRRA